MIRFKIGGLQIEINFMFVAAVCIFLLLDKSGMSAIALLACFIHELSHIIIFAAVGYTPQKLSLELTGIKLTKPATALSRGKELLVQFAGSGANLLIFFLLINTIDKISIVSLFAVTHLVLGIFNLLPLKSFDGGKILSIILSYFLSMGTTEKICNAVDFIGIFAMLICCIFMIITSRGSFSLLSITVLLMLSALMKLSRKLS